MRGKDRGAVPGGLPAGITPAYAGKSSLSAFSVGRFRDHPRVCGEKQHGSKHQIQVKGSPPRMRGKAHRVALAAGVAGITPAYAGKR